MIKLGSGDCVINATAKVEIRLGRRRRRNPLQRGQLEDIGSTVGMQSYLTGGGGGVGKLGGGAIAGCGALLDLASLTAS